jgi:ATP-dependent helicase/nuclease subunit A
MELQGLVWEEPSGLDLREIEKRYLDAERRRVVYVAASRTRDLLVVPRAGSSAPGKIICADLLAGADPALVRELETYRAGEACAWAREAGDPILPARPNADGIDRETAARWVVAATEAARPRFRPAAVSGAASRPRVDDIGDLTEPGDAAGRDGRFGPAFGTAVHQAVVRLLIDATLDPGIVARLVAERFGITDRLNDVTGDVTRALATLAAERIVRPIAADVQLEYPVAGADGTIRWLDPEGRRDGQ